MSDAFTDAELEAYLDESLDAPRANELEQACRDDKDLLNRLSLINRRRDAGIHTLGEIWRRHQVGVPSAEKVGEYLRGALSANEADYLQFRLETLKCRYTIALVEAAEAQLTDTDNQSQTRRDRYFKKSADLLPKGKAN